MKWLDDVRVTTDKYENQGIKKGAIGTIILSEIRDYQYYVVFSDHNGRDYAETDIYLWDLELETDRGLSDESILGDLPLHNPEWWCKVEDGFILNLKGEKKNKIAYDYQS